MFMQSVFGRFLIAILSDEVIQGFSDCRILVNLVRKTTSSVSEKNHVLSEWKKTTSSVSEKNHVLS